MASADDSASGRIWLADAGRPRAPKGLLEENKAPLQGGQAQLAMKGAQDVQFTESQAAAPEFRDDGVIDVSGRVAAPDDETLAVPQPQSSKGQAAFDFPQGTLGVMPAVLAEAGDVAESANVMSGMIEAHTDATSQVGLLRLGADVHLTLLNPNAPVVPDFVRNNLEFQRIQ